MSLKQLSPPTGELLGLTALKRRLRVPDNESDADLVELERAALELLGGRVGRQIVPAVWGLHLDRFPAVIELRVCPVLEVDDVEYLDAAGELVELDASLYSVDVHSEPGRIKPKPGRSWPPTANDLAAVRVTFTAGYDPPANVPETIRQAAYVLIDYWYDQPDEFGRVSAEIARTVDALLDSVRWTR